MFSSSVSLNFWDALVAWSCKFFAASSVFVVTSWYFSLAAFSTSLNCSLVFWSSSSDFLISSFFSISFFNWFFRSEKNPIARCWI